MLDSCQDSRANLRNAAFLYRNYGWSVVPVRGDSDPSSPKVAGVAWSAYQRRLPTYSEIRSWFDDGRFLGLGIVCGRVSGLAVLDFDDPDCLEAFGAYCPHLLNTYAVESGTRGLPHLYYEVPEAVEMRSRRAAGVDLQFDGTYVIAPPTVIQGRSWHVLNDVVPQVLTQADVDLIERFLQTWNYAESENQQNLEHLPVDLYRNTSNGISRPEVSLDALVNWYKQLAHQIGRNNALFRVGCLARDSGWKLQHVMNLLLDIHVVQPPGGLHVVETPEQRRREGLHTLRSAFRYPVQSRAPAVTKNSGLPNVIRETLLQFKQTAVARVLDGLRLAGVQAGHIVSERVVCHLLKAFNIGRRTIQAVLKTISPEGMNIFESPRNPPKEPAGAAKAGKDQQKQCIFVSGAKRVKNGRPARTYIVPDNKTLYQLYGVQPSGSDTLLPADLKTPETYRRALHQKLIERRPGLYSRRWLSARLGVSVWTTRRYDRQIGLSASDTYFSKRIYWSNIEELPHAQDRPNGTFIETPEGRRYPPLQGLARRLLQEHAFLIYKRQHWNYYTLYPKGDELPERSVADWPQPEKIVDRDLIHKHEPAQCNTIDATEPTAAYALCRACKRLYRVDTGSCICPKCGSPCLEPVPEAIWRDPDRCRVWWRELWQEEPTHISASETTPSAQARLAEQVYATVRQRTPEHALTRALATQLVQTYDEVTIQRALDLLAERRNVYNAAGFLMTVLGGRGTHKQRAAAQESHADWLKRLRNSPYAAFYELQ